MPEVKLLAIGEIEKEEFAVIGAETRSRWQIRCGSSDLSVPNQP